MKPVVRVLKSILNFYHYITEEGKKEGSREGKKKGRKVEMEETSRYQNEIIIYLLCYNWLLKLNML